MICVQLFWHALPESDAWFSCFPLVPSCFPLVPSCFPLVPSCSLLFFSCFSLVFLLFFSCFSLVFLLFFSRFSLVFPAYTASVADSSNYLSTVENSIFLIINYIKYACVEKCPPKTRPIHAPLLPYRYQSDSYKTAAVDG